MLKNSFLLTILFFLISCTGWDNFKSAVTGEKKQTTDEYLIKNKDPLILPPDYEKLPLPSNEKLKSEEANSIEDILTDKGSEQDTKKKKSPLETRIEEELRRGN